MKFKRKSKQKKKHDKLKKFNVNLMVTICNFIFGNTVFTGY